MKSSKKYHLVYITIKKSTGQFYIGKHSTNNLNDGYIGSGDWIKNQKKKPDFDKNDFVCYSQLYQNQAQAFKTQRLLVNRQTLQQHKCMNIKPGGGGGRTKYADLTQLQSRLLKQQIYKFDVNHNLICKYKNIDCLLDIQDITVVQLLHNLYGTSQYLNGYNYQFKLYQDNLQYYTRFPL